MLSTQHYFNLTFQVLSLQLRGNFNTLRQPNIIFINCISDS